MVANPHIQPALLSDYKVSTDPGTKPAQYSSYSSGPISSSASASSCVFAASTMPGGALTAAEAAAAGAAGAGARGGASAGRTLGDGCDTPGAAGCAYDWVSAAPFVLLQRGQVRAAHNWEAQAQPIAMSSRQ